MPTLLDYLVGRNLKNRLPEKAHFTEKQWIHASLSSWREGAAGLGSLFPRDTRRDKPKRWYELLRSTHWEDKVPPGNGPFFVPDWAFLTMEYEEAEGLRNTLKKAGFKEKEVPVALVPATSEYLHVAMRAAGEFKWNLNPMLYQVYWYPWLGKGDKLSLRDYSTTRWSARTMANEDF